jgi:hypothetical protein
VDSKAEMYIKRARTEFETAEILEGISINTNLKESFNISPDSTYYSGVISHAY